MSNDLQAIKKKISVENRIEEILEKLGCHSIKAEKHGDVYTAGLPDGDNPRSIRILNNEHLNCSIYTRGIEGGDIYDLVSYCKIGARQNTDFKQSLHKAKRWLIDNLGYDEFLNGEYEKKQTANISGWLKAIKQKRSKDVDIESLTKNEVISTNVKSEFYMLPHFEWVREGIECETQEDFEVGYDIDSNRIVTMIHNMNGEMIGVKGRTLENDYNLLKIPKYLYLHKMNKSIELFNLHRATPYIIEKREVFIFEGYKSVMKCWQYGVRNCVSIEGDSISAAQIYLLKRLGLDIKFIFCFDKDKSTKDIRGQAAKVLNRELFALYDMNNLLESKQSPVDKGEIVWRKLASKRFKITSNNVIAAQGNTALNLCLSPKLHSDSV